MTRKTLPLTDALHAYLLDVSLRESPLLAHLRSETAALPEGGMQIAAEQGQFLALLVRLGGVKRIIEIGTFTGYSSLVMALALPEAGRIVACDVNEEWTAIAKRYWQEAGVADKVTLRLGPALATLDGLLDAGEAGSWDMAFIDADKENYIEYYERALTLLRSGGLVVADNTLWGGRVIDDTNRSASTRGIRAFNQFLATDPRIDLSLVPIGDGVTLALKR
ncbi:MAG: class I SAM-dependent methyltransferase [Rhodospirillales bacterium]